ncbi:signal peptidase I [Nocardioides sp. LML1-1-1.1]|uniref:signal peptidase I n=1 Tax=Nocardioides sp. LML1-1-1.1 TaxID=3135248 RepID=UPI00342DAA76
MTRTQRIARELVLWTGGALGALCLLALLAGWLLNVTPLVFQSGSMSPSYDAGALGIARKVPASELRVGDVVSVESAQGGRVTHRVVAISGAEDGRALLRLQGDTNPAPDTETYAVRTADRVAFGVPKAGYVLSAASTPVGLLLGGLLVVGSIFLGFRPQGPRPGAPAGRRHAAIAVGAVSALTIGGAIGASGLAPFSPTGALWSDSATANATITATGGDTTPPVLSNPLPADGASATTWGGLDCADSGAGFGQICVNATDTGGSGVSTVTVKLVRTNNGVLTCWNGTAFIAGNGCSAQTMLLVSGSQYRTNNLSAVLMTQGGYTATFTATDVAGNSATLTTAFAVQPTPVITACVPINGNNPYNLTWTWAGAGNPDSFKLYYGGGGSLRTPTTFAGNVRNGQTQSINNEAGTFRLVAVIGGVESALSNPANYSGNGNKNCAIP